MFFALHRSDFHAWLAPHHLTKCTEKKETFNQLSGFEQELNNDECIGGDDCCSFVEHGKKCGKGEGSCTFDEDCEGNRYFYGSLYPLCMWPHCAGSLICGWNNCNTESIELEFEETDNCCTEIIDSPSLLERKLCQGEIDCCNVRQTLFQCQLEEGDCDTDIDCEGWAAFIYHESK